MKTPSKEDLYNKYRKDEDCFELIDKCKEYLVIIDKEMFDKKGGDYDYYITSMFHEITPYCGCGSDTKDKIEKMLYFINKGLSDKEIETLNGIPIMGWFEAMKNSELQEISMRSVNTVYNNELLYSYMDKDGLFEHGTSIGGCWLTPKGEFVKEFLKTYYQYELQKTKKQSHPTENSLTS